MFDRAYAYCTMVNLQGDPLGCRRLVIYPEGGSVQERYVPGPGWIVADTEEWGVDQDRVRVIRNAAMYMFLPVTAGQQ